MPDAYDHISLMCRLKAAQTRNKELESGERYIKLKELHQKECRAYERKIQALLTEIADAHKETIHVRNYWFQVLEDMLQEFEAMQKKADQKLQEMEERALLAERQRDEALEKAKEEKQAHGEIETYYPGFLLPQDTYYVRYIKGVGHIYQQTVIDNYI